MRILVVEDEKKLATFIKQGLKEEHYAVDLAADGVEGLKAAQSGLHDAIILDIMLPRMDGIEIVRTLRAEGVATPVLMLTAKSTTADKVQGLDAGADDYLAKPFVFEELIARLRSLLRRSSAEKTSALRAGDLVLDIVSHKARRGEREIELTAKEYSLLEYLIRNKNRVLGRSVIAQHVWAYNFFTESNIIDVYINRLRHKVDDGHTVRLIHSIRGVGYILKDEEDASE